MRERKGYTGGEVAVREAARGRGARSAMASKPPPRDG